MVLALSGGGDSIALLHLAADWAKARGRRLVAVTVDHGLNPDSAGWSRACEAAARGLGVDWIGRVWTGDKPLTGVAAAARAARHALIARTAREVGARVILFAHTLDDVAEGEAMRAGGATLGQLRDWSPSPVWPEGRELMLMRPLLAERRADLRAFLSARGAGWIDDPANTDPRHHRARVRQVLEGRALESRADVALPDAGLPLPVPVRALPFGAGFVAQRDIPATALAAVLLSASGGTTPPRGERLARLMAHLRGGEAVSAVLAGARAEADGDRVVIGREPGELRRAGRNCGLDLAPGAPQVWDGRIEITVNAPGWRVEAAQGRLNRLSREDRQALSALPAWARGGAAVLIRDGADAPVLAGRVATVRHLAPRRLQLALSGRGFTPLGLTDHGETTQEDGLFAAVHGETPTTDLFSDANKKSAAPVRAPEDRKPK